MKTRFIELCGLFGAHVMGSLVTSAAWILMLAFWYWTGAFDLVLKMIRALVGALCG